ncbi:hypothetical protein KIN20_013534 [Parelaphostrongylus tenuis]|uniref:Cytochrome P450 n=1 Tax=Parelaphostrongylus tenuis TaxID=148309 RepID=A0AAD5MGU2_PARTN|nr:hypothetical protein KIN20_013534 [Parelaphostrongylus tenuis]
MITESLILLAIVYIVNELYWKRKHLPPGPTPLPFIGNLHVLTRHEPGYSAFKMWRKQYGPIYTYWIGSHPFVILSDYKTKKDTYAKGGESYAGKFHFSRVLTEAFRGGHYGILDPVGPMWRDHRRISLLCSIVIYSARSFCLLILAEVEAMSRTLHTMKGEEIAIKVCFSNEQNCQNVFDVRIESVINQLLFGYRFEGEISKPASFLMFTYPLLRMLPYFKGMWKELMIRRDAFFSFFDRQIVAHQKKIDFKTEEFSDYVEAYLKEKRRREETATMNRLATNNCEICALWVICSTICTFNAICASRVEVQPDYSLFSLDQVLVKKKMHRELDREIGSGRLITMSDKNNLPYTCAVINEIQRLANLLPLNMLRETLSPVQVGKWSLPAHTGVIAQVSDVLYDDEIFPSPLSFDPNRFIDTQGKLKKVEDFIPFSMGKRQCLGEGSARMELFLFIANLSIDLRENFAMIRSLKELVRSDLAQLLKLPNQGVPHLITCECWWRGLKRRLAHRLA